MGLVWRFVDGLILVFCLVSGFLGGLGVVVFRFVGGLIQQLVSLECIFWVLAGKKIAS